MTLNHRSSLRMLQKIKYVNLQINLEISTGLLNTIKKVKNKFHCPLNAQVIISVLDQSTKNDLLTFQMMEQSEEQIQQFIHGDCDTNALTNLDSFYLQRKLRNMILNGIEMRYEKILIGRYQNQQRMIDPEHSDLVQSTILEAPQHLISSSQQSQQSQQSSEYQLLQKQKLISLKQQGRSRNLQRDSLTVIVKPKLNSKHTINSPDVTNVHSKPTSQYTNQLTYNVFSSFNIISYKAYQSIIIICQSLKRVKSRGKFVPIGDKSTIILEVDKIQIRHGFLTYYILDQSSQDVEKSKNQRFSQSVSRKIDPSSLANLIKGGINSFQIIIKVIQWFIALITHYGKQIQSLSMFSYSLRMRNQALGHNRRQNLDQFKILEQLIYDNDFQEFSEHLQQVPQMYIDRRLENNDTLLILASKSGCKDMVKELIKMGADINIQNQDDGNTAVHVALSYGHYKIADILIRAGANTNILNNIGKNAWSIL
ncbi:unnamed protein product (macronuclear) [Paramecium tetraurelia]|uniref:Uncharacterized protein n=1 Tax=Paramecium tetraurelia TaxID=5888 RepID=A0E0V2_PARTE|nr:uncharacterized protein GSPATT00022087001 [Paramecium tetraurelia]CAK88919.1 unnamed protein product [Paramecium tetraurelia]|eukprot:XP_001456316.1 hypothetical protein (macronuclear) [Paramecium tetraurelia strain d4-2]